uniref:Uncharacterized protein n=1 Tax=Lactuca sativa TaxID=4236 RepID=A0A9R1XPS3_LACSA|nr:hypothetical protein LSAT_V11C200088160 [Lactuca sativa]
MAAAAVAAATTATNPKLSLLRPHFCPPRHAFYPTTPYLNLHGLRNASTFIQKQRRLLLLPPRAFTLDVPGPLLQDAGATIIVVGGAYGLVAGFDYLTQRQIIEQVSLNLHMHDIDINVSIYKHTYTEYLLVLYE